MPDIDPRHIVLAGLLIAVFCSVILLLVRRTFADTIPGVAAWAWGCIVVVLASVLFALRPAVPSTFSLVSANAVLTGGLLLLYAGLCAFIEKPVNGRLLACAWVVLVCLLTGLISGGELSIATSLIGLFNGTVFIASGAALLRNAHPGLIGWLTGGAFLLTASVSYARSFTIAQDFQVPASLFEPFLLQRLYIASFPFVLLTTTIGFVLMVNEKVRAVVAGMNASLESAVEKRTAELHREIARRKALEREVAQLIDGERRRVGQELHDNLGQRMTGLSLLAEALAARLKTVSPELSDQASALERAASEAIVETRRLAHGLMPVVPGAKGLRAALAELAESVSRKGRLHCGFYADAAAEVDDEYAATQLFRIAQESVGNLIRHGQASRAAIRLDRKKGKTVLSIADNGAGFSRSEGERGVGRGLRIMAYRASLIGYDLEIDSAPGTGTTIMVSGR